MFACIRLIQQTKLMTLTCAVMAFITVPPNRYANGRLIQANLMIAMSFPSEVSHSRTLNCPQRPYRGDSRKHLRRRLREQLVAGISWLADRVRSGELAWLLASCKNS